MMKFATFSEKCQAAGVSAHDCGKGHWRIHGKVQVNFYPFSKRRTIWVNGTTNKTSFSGSDDDAISAAKGDALGIGNKTKRRGAGWVKRMRFRLWKRFSNCYYCRTPLTIETITIDHKIPLARGGSNYFDNLVPACQKCNRAKGNQLW